MSPKRIVALLLALVLCAPTFGAARAADNAIYGNFALVWNTDTLNLRSQASSGSEWLGSYSRNTWVEILGSQNNFYRVKTPDGKIGYMSKNYLDVACYYDHTVAIVNNAKSTAFLNFRAYPSYSAKVLGILYNGVPLYVTGYADGWYQVMLNEVEGYVRGEYVYTEQYPANSTVATIKTPNNSALNLRAGPGSGYQVLRQLPGDTYVMVLARGDYWWYVSANGYVGFISLDFIADGLQTARDIAAREGGGGDGDGYAVVSNPSGAQRLNLRTAATTSAQVVSKLSNGTQLTVIRQGTEWCEVYASFLGLSGYVMTKYLTMHGLPTTPTCVIEHPNGSYVNLRQSSSLTSGVVTRMSSGATATVLAPGSDWTKVKYNGKTGYVLNYFMK